MMGTNIGEFDNIPYGYDLDELIGENEIELLSYTMGIPVEEVDNFIY